MALVRSLVLGVFLVVQLLGQTIPSSVLFGHWIITARIDAEDTAWCDEQCGKISFGRDYRATVVSSQQQELSFRWLITGNILNFYDDVQKRKRRKEKMPRIPGKFLIEPLDTDSTIEVLLTHTLENYTYILIPDTTQESETSTHR